MAVGELGVKTRLRVPHFGKELFATVCATKHGHDLLSMCNVIWKVARWEDEIAEG